MKNALASAALTHAQNTGEYDGDAEELSSATLHPLRFLGMGLLIAWLCCTHINTIYIDGASSIKLASETGMRIGDVGAFAIMAIYAKKIGALSLHRSAASVLIAVTAIGTAVIGLWLAPVVADLNLVFFVGIPTAIGGAVLFCLWAEAYCQMGTTSMVVYGGGSLVTAFATYILISTMMEPYAIIATSLLPLISGVCVWKSFKILPHESRRVATVNYPVPWKIVGIMGIAGVASGVTGVILGEFVNLGAVHRIWAQALAGGLLIYMGLHRPGMFDMRVMTRVCLGAAVVAFVILPLASVGFAEVVSLLMKFAFVWVAVFVLAMLANLAYRFDLPSLRLFALARVCSEGGIFIGVLMREALKNSSVEFNFVSLSVAAVLGLVVVGVCVLIWKSEKAVNADWGAAGISLESGEHEPGPRERLIDRCERLAEEYALTEREREMLMLICQGKTRTQIEQELFLSQNTVKTHIRHLYGKLGVHSKEEACELVGVE